MKIKKLSRKTFAVLMASILTVGAVFPATVSNASGDYSNKTLTRGSSLLVGPEEKTTATGTSAKVTMNDAISQNDIVNAYVRNAQGVRVTDGDAASFRGTARGATKNMPYQTGKGKKGNNFYINLLLAQNSASQTLVLSFHFVP